MGEGHTTQGPGGLALSVRRELRESLDVTLSVKRGAQASSAATVKSRTAI